MWQLEAPFLGWVIASILIGLGFTFFSGAVEAWLVDALKASGFEGEYETVFAKGQTTLGVAMLVGSVTGGFVAQVTNLGVPYILRALLLALTFGAAFFLMHDIGFVPRRGGKPVAEIRRVLTASLDNGWRKPPIRWLMLAAPFTGGVGVYAFYALQPYLLELYGDPNAFGIAGLAAAIVAGAQILAGLLVASARKLFRTRTGMLIVSGVISAAALLAIGLTSSFWVAISLLVVWSLAFSIAMPMRQSYLNGLIDSDQRATVLSFDALMASSGGVVAQPALGRAADVWSYSASYVLSSAIQVLAVPFILLARREKAPTDPIE
jgi:predicted MFS family arabinose efflux permease